MQAPSHPGPTIACSGPGGRSVPCGGSPSPASCAYSRTWRSSSCSCRKCRYRSQLPRAREGAAGVRRWRPPYRATPQRTTFPRSRGGWCSWYPPRSRRCRLRRGGRDWAPPRGGAGVGRCSGAGRRNNPGPGEGGGDPWPTAEAPREAYLGSDWTEAGRRSSATPCRRGEGEAEPRRREGRWDSPPSSLLRRSGPSGDRPGIPWLPGGREAGREAEPRRRERRWDSPPSSRPSRSGPWPREAPQGADLGWDWRAEEGQGQTAEIDRTEEEVVRLLPPHRQRVRRAFPPSVAPRWPRAGGGAGMGAAKMAPGSDTENMGGAGGGGAKLGLVAQGGGMPPPPRLGLETGTPK